MTQHVLPAMGLEGQAVCLASSSRAPASSHIRSSILPFGNTLHYAGCGCPAAWQQGSRVADQVDALVARSYQQFQKRLISPNRPLRVCYMLPHHNITGGMKCLVEHVRLLRARGHFTIAVHRSDTAKRAMPLWTTVEADADVVCNLHQRLSDVYPVQEIDVVVVGIFHQVAELLAGVHAPVLYWEQGHEWVFGDPIRLQMAQNYLKQDQLFHTVMHLPCVLAAVSSAVQEILQQEFGRHSLLIPNGIDCERFTPGPWQPATAIKAAAEAAPASQDSLAVAAAEVAAAAAAAAAGCGSQLGNAAAGAAAGVPGCGEAAGTTVALVGAAAAGVPAEKGEDPARKQQQLMTPEQQACTVAELDAAAAAAAAAEAAQLAVLHPAASLEQKQHECSSPAAPHISSTAAAQALCPGVELSSSPEQQHTQQPAAAADSATAVAPAAAVDAAVAPAAAGDSCSSAGSRKKRIIIVGNPALPLKGFPTAIAALAAVSAMLPICVRWVCQVLPSPATVPNLPLVDFELETVVSPSQAELPGLYRGNDVFMFSSRYEAWGMPVLEAMASGLPVVTTDCLGVRTFCKHGENCLLAAPDDATGLAQHLLAVLTDASLQARLSEAGRATALQYTPGKVMDHLEAVLYCLTACGPELLRLRQTCLLDLQIACAQASEACSRPGNAAQQQAAQQQQQLALLQVQLKQQVQRQQAAAAAAAEQSQRQKLLHVLLQQQQQQQGLAGPQQVRLQSLHLLQQLNLAAPQQHLALLQQQQHQHMPLQASLLMPFLQVQQPSAALQSQARVSGPLHHHQQQHEYAQAVLGEVLKHSSQQLIEHSSQQLIEHRSLAGQQQLRPLLQLDLLPNQQQQQQQQHQQQNTAALQVLQQLQAAQQQPPQQQQQSQQQQAALLSVLQGGSSSSAGQLSTCLLQQHQPLPLPASTFQQQQHQLQIPLLSGVLDSTSIAAAAGGLSLEHMSQQHQAQLPLLTLSQQQQQAQLLLPPRQCLQLQQQQQQQLLPLAISQQLPLGLSQLLPLGFGHQQAQQQLPLQLPLGMLQQQQHLMQQQQELRLLPQL